MVCKTQLTAGIIGPRAVRSMVPRRSPDSDPRQSCPAQFGAAAFTSRKKGDTTDICTSEISSVPFFFPEISSVPFFSSLFPPSTLHVARVLRGGFGRRVVTCYIMPGQTLREIRALLAAGGLNPQHRFGQNFLIDLNLMRKLVAAAELSPDDVVLEVGPGTGSLTEMLLDAGVRVVAVEIDRGFQAILRERLAANQRFTLVQGDALAGKHRVNPLVLNALRQTRPGAGGSYKLVANLPYQIATPQLVDLLLVEPQLERMEIGRAHV